MDIRDKLQHAQTLYSTLYLGRHKYTQAMPYYKFVLSKLFQINPKTPEVSSKIQQILVKAQSCQKLAQQSKTPPLQNSTQWISRAVQGKSSNLNRLVQPRQKTRQAPDQYRQLILDQIIQLNSVSFQDISGLQTAKQAINQSIILPNQYPHLFTGLRAPPKGILLFGPPGTGKTLIAKAVASSCASTFINISSSTLTSKFYGEGEKIVRALFEVARQRAPSVIFLDEVDSYLSSRGENQHESSKRILTEFLVQMDGLGSDDGRRLLVMGATNCPDVLDQAVLRRFPKRIMIDLPDKNTRKNMIAKLLEGQPCKISQRELDRIAGQLNFYSGSDISALCKEAAMASIRGLSQKQMEREDIPKIGVKHFEQALKVIKQSVSKQSLQRYQKWNQEFGGP